MCTVSINVDENALRVFNPELSGNEAISRWVQLLVDDRVKDMKAQCEQDFVEVDIDSL